MPERRGVSTPEYNFFLLLLLTVLQYPDIGILDSHAEGRYQDGLDESSNCDGGG